MIPKSLNGSVYSKVNYFHKFKDLISQKNVTFEFLKVLKTMINRTFFFQTPPPNEARSHFVSGCI